MDNSSDKCIEHTKTEKKSKLLETSFLLSVTGISMLGGFGMALAMAKRKDPGFFLKLLDFCINLDDMEIIISNKDKEKLLLAGYDYLVHTTGKQFIRWRCTKQKLEKGMMPTKELPESGSSLAIRALGWGTLYAVSGFSLFCFGVWKLMAVNDLHEFRYKVGNFLPRIPKSENPGRSDFKNLRDLLNYIIEESDKGKKT